MTDDPYGGYTPKAVQDDPYGGYTPKALQPSPAPITPRDTANMGASKKMTADEQETAIRSRYEGPSRDAENEVRRFRLQTPKGWFGLANKTDKDIADTLGLDYSQIKSATGYKEGMLTGLISKPGTWGAKWKSSWPGRVMEGLGALGGSVTGLGQDIFAALGADPSNATLTQAINQTARLSQAHLNPDAGIKLPVLGKVDVLGNAGELALAAATGPGRIFGQGAKVAAAQLGRTALQGALLGAVTPGQEGTTAEDRLWGRAGTAALGGALSVGLPLVGKGLKEGVGVPASKVINAVKGRYKPGLPPALIKEGMGAPGKVAREVEEAVVGQVEKSGLSPDSPPPMGLEDIPTATTVDEALATKARLGGVYDEIAATTPNVPVGNIELSNTLKYLNDLPWARKQALKLGLNAAEDQVNVLVPSSENQILAKELEGQIQALRTAGGVRPIGEMSRAAAHARTLASELAEVQRAAELAPDLAAKTPLWTRAARLETQLEGQLAAARPGHRPLDPTQTAELQRLEAQLAKAQEPTHMAFAHAKEIASEVKARIRAKELQPGMKTSPDKELADMYRVLGGLESAIDATAKKAGTLDALKGADKEYAKVMQGVLHRPDDAFSTVPSKSSSFFTREIAGRARTDVQDLLQHVPQRGREALAAQEIRDAIRPHVATKVVDSDFGAMLKVLSAPESVEKGMAPFLTGPQQAYKRGVVNTIEFLDKVQRRVGVMTGVRTAGGLTQVINFLGHAAAGMGATSKPAIRFYAALSKIPPGSRPWVDYVEKSMRTKWGKALMAAERVGRQRTASQGGAPDAPTIDKEPSE